MKRTLAALALLLLAAPAPADVAVVRHRNGASAYADDHEYQSLISVLRNYGADFFEVRAPKTTAAAWPNNIATQSRTGNFVFGQQTKTADVVIHFGLDLNGGLTAAQGDSIQKLTLSTNWPNKPTIFFGSTQVAGDMYTQTASCSTGVNGYPGPYPTGATYYSSYLVGIGHARKTMTGNSLHVAAVGSAGIFRAVVRDGPSQASRPFNATTALGYNYACTSCDSMGFAATDSIKMWARYRSAIEPAPVIYCPGPADPTLMKMALAMADSASGGLLFENADKYPRKRGIVIRRAFSRGRYDAMNSTNGGGTFCAADSCDSVNVKAGIDSLASLNVPFTVMVEIDSVFDGVESCRGAVPPSAGYVHERGWWARAPLAQFGVEGYAGTLSATAGDANASAPAYLWDPLGYTRARNMIPPGATALPPTVDYLVSGDSSVYSLSKAILDRMECAFPGKVRRVIWPAYNDYSPSSDTRAGSPKTQDSLAWVLSAAGFRAVLFNPLEPTGSVGRSVYNTGSGFGVQAAATAPRGFYNVGRLVPVRVPGSTTTTGFLKLLPVRMESTTLNWNWAAGHQIKDEYEQGDLNADWYPDWPGLGGNMFYIHEFLMRTPIIAFNVQELGGAGQGTTPTRKAWWNIKWAVNGTKAVDALMIPGKRLDVWVYADEVDP